MENRVMQGSDSVKIFELCTQSVMLLKKCTIFKKTKNKKKTTTTHHCLLTFSNVVGGNGGKNLLTLNSWLEDQSLRLLTFFKITVLRP